jgi:hypothetical protein
MHKRIIVLEKVRFLNIEVSIDISNIFFSFVPDKKENNFFTQRVYHSKLVYKSVLVRFVGAHLSRSTFVLRKTGAVAFVPRETNWTSNVYPKKLICVTNVLRSSFLRDRKAHLSHDF